MKKSYQAPHCNTAVLQPATFMNLSGGGKAEDPIDSAKGNSIKSEENITEWEDGNVAEEAPDTFSYNL